MKEFKRTFLKEFLDTWTICSLECGACFYHGPIVPHNYLELPPPEWAPPSEKCPSFEHFKFRAYTGVGRGDFARIMMASSLLTLADSSEAREIGSEGLGGRDEKAPGATAAIRSPAKTRLVNRTSRTSSRGRNPSRTSAGGKGGACGALGYPHSLLKDPANLFHPWRFIFFLIFSVYIKFM